MEGSFVVHRVLVCTYITYSTLKDPTEVIEGGQVRLINKFSKTVRDGRGARGTAALGEMGRREGFRTVPDNNGSTSNAKVPTFFNQHEYVIVYLVQGRSVSQYKQYMMGYFITF